VRLVGLKPNLEAIGARVALYAGGRARVDTVLRGGSILAASDAALHFGLGPADSIDHLRVDWPDGSTSKFSGDDLPVDSVITIRQGMPVPSARPFVRPDSGLESGTSATDRPVSEGG
jgi:enediyne biosynthesis protein E4